MGRGKKGGEGKKGGVGEKNKRGRWISKRRKWTKKCTQLEEKRAKVLGKNEVVFFFLDSYFQYLLNVEAHREAHVHEKNR